MRCAKSLGLLFLKVCHCECYAKSELISAQNRSHGAIFSGHEKAAILPQCEKNESNRSYNAQWSIQKKGTLICQKLEKNVRAFRSQVWFAADGLSEPIEEKNWIFAESDGAYAAVRVVLGGYSWEAVDERRAKEVGNWFWILINSVFCDLIK